jgi:hypothetical protein
MRAVAMLVLILASGAGCIAAEPGKETQNASARKACSDLEGLTFQVGVPSPQTVTFVADDAEYSTYSEVTDDGTQNVGLAQCIDAGPTNIIYLDGAIDHHSARADLRSNTTQIYLQWSDGRWLVSY